ncbi:MAG TPA: rhodanese-like domain-containing protein [Gammaproteobacteria bacterium]|nr:rhodanese-like domain-containing protein [Gammaproteobacteria bacterium]
MEEFTNFLFDEWPLTLAFIFITVLIGRSFLEPILSGVKTLTAQDAVRMINDGNTVVLDVRVDKEFNEGHILDSIHIPFGMLDSRIRELDEHKAKAIIVNCQNGMRSKQAGSILKKHGFTKLFSIDGGMNGWINANFPVTKKEKRKGKKTKNKSQEEE